MLYNKEKHFTNNVTKWSQAKATGFIEHYFSSAEKAFSREKYWGNHPSDYDELFAEKPRCLYRGLAGVVWSQYELEKIGYGSIINSYSEILYRARIDQEIWLDQTIKYENKSDYIMGLFMGILGIMIAEWRCGGGTVELNDIIRTISQNYSNLICEYMWGSAGSVSVSVSLLQDKTDENLINFVKSSIEDMKNRITSIPGSNIAAWNQNLYGRKECMLGAVHGFSGNAFSVIKSFSLLSDSERKYWSNIIIATLKETAHEEDSKVNWKKFICNDDTQSNDYLLQMCHGAPGVISCTSGLMNQYDEEFDKLLLKAGELIWSAGPLKKGANICHGTSGNGYAFLKLFEATNDEVWLDRAKKFAMTSISQIEENKLRTGNYHYSLWSGDTGVVHFLASCIAGSAKIPAMDYL